MCGSDFLGAGISGPDPLGHQQLSDFAPRQECGFSEADLSGCNIFGRANGSFDQAADEADSALV